MGGLSWVRGLVWGAVVCADSGAVILHQSHDSRPFIVLAFTPAEIAEFPGHYAPAVLTLVMDVMLQGAATTLQGGVILLVSYLAMVVGVGVFGIARPRNKRATTDAPDPADS